MPASTPQPPAAKIEAAIKLLREIAGTHAPVGFACSFGVEDMVLIDLINQHGLAIDIFTLDTGRLPQETYDLMQQVRERYSREVKVYFPQAVAVEAYVNANGINAFYNSVDLRKGCCAIRKLEPLARALKDKKAWITGLRRSQSTTRLDAATQEFDDAHGIWKFNPLVDWSEKETWDYIRAYAVPYNALHDQFYPSIGCAPCTRSITPGEDIRAGRWWWENPELKECGLHQKIVPITPIHSNKPKEPVA